MKSVLFLAECEILASERQKHVASYMPASGLLLEGPEAPDDARLQEVEKIIASEDFRPNEANLSDHTGVSIDPVKKYLYEISAIPLLLAADEIALETGLLSAEDLAVIRTSIAGEKPLNPPIEKRWREATER